MRADFFFFFSIWGGTGGPVQVSLNATIVRESYISILVIYLQYFYIFEFCKRKEMNMYMYMEKESAQILALVSYAPRLFFQRGEKKTHVNIYIYIYANEDKREAVQKMALNVRLSGQTGKWIHPPSQTWNPRGECLQRRKRWPATSSVLRGSLASAARPNQKPLPVESSF